ncbi:MAG TPA: endopeptidase La, partial [Thermoanaerobaculia bacterium]|nr:endopeptidase La [Thermoanaerobaculia bacterium]
MAKRSDGPAEEPVRLPDLLPVLPLKDVVVFPYIILPLSIGRDRNVQAVDRALARDRLLMLVAQKDPAVEEATTEDLYPVGTAAAIMRMLKLPDGRLRILVQGLSRARIEHLTSGDHYLQARISDLADSSEPTEAAQDLEVQALMRSVKENLERAASLGKNISSEVMIVAANIEEPGRLADLAASNLELRIGDAQEVLEELRPVVRLQRVNDLLIREIQLLTMQEEISSQARGEIDRTQREYYLRQQLRAIQQELGEGEELGEEIEGLRRAASKKRLSPAAVEELERQIKRLQRSQPDSAETAVTRTYLEWLTGLPWGIQSEERIDLEHAQRVLDRDHYDLEKVKERILEFLAVRKLSPGSRGPILCFVGPPGVGKTSLGRSIAQALGRRFVRLSLGGVRDEAEIRGHRRTYVGALPGRILQSLMQAGTSNPVFMLDEIDKIGADFRGDPSSALLEVLDPEQNNSFRDHYLGVDYDLSQVMFITTANLLDPIQPAFLDRMEVIRLTGYTSEEKLHIARRHLIPKQLGENGLTGSHVSFTKEGIQALISEYTREAGVRNLEREIAAVCRKVAVGVAKGKKRRVVVNPRRVAQFLGPSRHFSEELLERDRVGVATGLAWTAAGGELMFIEAVSVPGSGKLALTGQLGDVMKESARAAVTYARSSPLGRELPTGYFAEHDLHIHVPAGSIPKDGPSAGITIATAILSLLTGRRVDRKLAMTGEITLRG